MAHQRRSIKTKLVEHFVIIKDQIPEIIEVRDGVGVALTGARMLRRINRKILGELVEAFVPDLSVSIVQID